MITFTPLASSSAGNCYWVSDNHTTLLLEAGMPIPALQRALDYRLSDVDGVLVSHEHGDHSKYAKALADRGVDVYASRGTLDALGMESHHRARDLLTKSPMPIGTWLVMPFDVEHDAAEPLGFLLANDEGEKLVFLTDTAYCRYTFTGLTHIAIEANFSTDLVGDNVAEGRLPGAVAQRLPRTHFSLEQAEAFLRANDLSQVEEIWLLHLSNGNSDERAFVDRIQALTGKPVYVAAEGSPA